MIARRTAVPKPEPKVVKALLGRVNGLVDKVCSTLGRDRVNLMEVCGTHTMAISSLGIRRAVDRRLHLLSGPGCPVCVTAQEEIDAAIALAGKPSVVVTTFGDMMRVPGSDHTLEQANAAGADVRMVYSALDAVQAASEDAGHEYVFLGVGFETTSPTIAASVLSAREQGVGNFSVLAMFKLIPPALRMIAGSDRVNVDGFILPGHVSVIIGTEPYRFLAEEFRMPSCVTGFEAADVLQGIEMLLEQMLSRPEVAIQYRRNVKPEGNAEARRLLDTVFEPSSAAWRGLGELPGSGLKFRKAFVEFDAGKKFRVKRAKVVRKTACRCGDVMLGVVVPTGCRLFGKACTPGTPVGPCMVSSEGACAAWYKYDRDGS
jgi:hydrogenase expression/formation protein HypD